MKTKLLIAACLALQFSGFAPKVVAQEAITYIDSYRGSALEDAKAVTVTVARSGNTNTAVNVDYSTKDGTAKAGVDYTPVFGALAFAVGETEKTISIPLAADDGLVDGDKTFRVCLTNATGGAVINTSEVLGTIQDNEVPANLDYSFNPVISSEYDDGSVWSFATLADGKLVIGGYFTRVNGVERSGLACLNTDGSLAEAFQTRVLNASEPGQVYQVTPLPDGRFYIAGNFDSVNGVERPGLARLLQDGSLDLSFAPTDVNYWPWIAQTDGKIISGTLRDGLVRLNLDGRRDNSFVPTLLTNWNVYAIAEHTDGNLLIAVGDVPNRIIRLNVDGSLDNSFGPVYFDGREVQKILVQPDKKILLTDFRTLERLNADGSLDTGFHAATVFETGWYDISLAECGKIIGLSGDPPTASRLNVDGSFDGTFPGFHIFGHLDLAGYWANITSIGPVAYVYGNFFTINGAVVNGVHRMLLDTPPRTGIDIQLDTRLCACRAYQQTIGENDGSLTVNVRRLGETTGPATVSYGTRDGTANAGKDYIATSGMLSFAPLEVEKIVTVPILDNALVDGRRTLELFLTNAVGAAFIAPPLTITILDDEVGFEPGTFKRLADGSMRMVAFRLTSLNAWLEVSSDLKNWATLTNVDYYFSPFETEFKDPDAARFPRRFYRLRTQ